MKKFHPGLWTYMKSINGNNLNVNKTVRSYAGGASSFFGVLSAIFLFPLGNNGMPIISLFGFMLSIGLLCLTFAIQNKPSLFALLPITHGRKVLYFFISAVFFTVVGFVIFLAAVLIIMLIVAIVILIAAREWIFVVEETEEAASVFVCAQGYFIAAAIVFAMIGLVLIISFIKRGKLKYALLALVPAIVSLPFYIIIALTGIGNGNLYIAFNAVPYSWVYVGVFCAIAAGLFAAGVARLILYLRPKEY